MHFKLLQEEQFKKLQKPLLIWLVIKSLIKLQQSQDSSKNSSEIVTNEAENIEHDKKIASWKKTKNIDDLRLI